ncbi:MAG: YihY/virulence factor BrkB family protein [Acidobacteria bacterium]|nr:YihY/virulence factor BrkB family protein [Acidobacteriota bacterium]
MKRRGHRLWTLGGMSLRRLMVETAKASWRDDVFGQGGRMAFYQFLAIFPSLLVVFAISERVPHLGGPMQRSLREMSGQVLPTEVAGLIETMMGQLTKGTKFGLQLVSVCAAAVWAAHNGTWAMIYGLNKAYEVQENRGWKRLTVTILGLTATLAVTGFMAMLLFFGSSYVAAYVHGSVAVLVAVEWLVLAVSAAFSFELLYRFGPNVPRHAWRWSTPGAMCALVLWIASTLVARLYFGHVDNYTRDYGQLNSVAMLLLWLYFSNGAMLIGGEMNSEIEKAGKAKP